MGIGSYIYEIFDNTPVISTLKPAVFEKKNYVFFIQRFCICKAISWKLTQTRIKQTDSLNFPEKNHTAG